LTHSLPVPPSFKEGRLQVVHDWTLPQQVGRMNIFLLGGAGLAAGAMNALAGGGSFVSLPAMIAAGVPSVQANASSTVALLPGGVASAWAYRDGLSPIGPVSLRSMLIATIAGGSAGAILLLKTSSSAFDLILPWLLLWATFTLAFGQGAGAWLRRRWRMKAGPILVIQFALGIYGGYFGGAVGLMMLAIWGMVTGKDIKTMHAPRTLLVSAANSMAVVIFIAARAVYWPETLVMLVAAAAGGYGGAQVGRRASSKVVRAGTLIITAGITVVFFIRAYS
jgi:uncharacterized protein